MDTVNPGFEVRWTLDEPPVKPGAWHKVSEAAAGTADEAGLEAGLGWPAGTLAVLRGAFQRKLDRGTGWEAAAGQTERAVRTAARIYKRGVGVRLEGQTFAMGTRSGAYPIRILGGAEPPAHLLRDEDFVVLDTRVAAAWPKLPQTRRRFIADLDEHKKTLASVDGMLTAWRAAGEPKHWTIVAGGLVSDVAAFAAGLASCTMSFVPTTLLAMADACVGGKTGVNFAPFGKNQLGLFHFPTTVDAWTGWLKTLPARELRAGGAECLKHAFLQGNKSLANGLAAALSSGSVDALVPLLPAVMGYKAEVVAEDPGENGKRAVLNFGHTLGHALESVSQKSTKGERTILHGEAVGVGLAFALTLSCRVAGLARADADEMIESLKRSGCLMSAAELAERLGVKDLANPKLYAQLRDLIHNDKKSQRDHGTSDWILLARPGAVARPDAKLWTARVFDAELAGAWQDFCKRA